MTKLYPYIGLILLVTVSLNAAAQTIIDPSSVPLSPPVYIPAIVDSTQINTHKNLPDDILCRDAQDVPVGLERIGSKPLLAVSSNVLLGVGTVFTGFHAVPLNIGLELPLGKHWSIYTDYTATVPWRAWNNNADCAQLIQLYLGGRWYPSRRKTPLGGWYLYGQAGAGYYDFERDGKGYQGEDILGSLGFGYSFRFGDHLRLNLGLGVGPIFTRYRYYEGQSGNQYLMYQYSGNWQYLGVTDARASLTWLFYRKKK